MFKQLVVLASLLVGTGSAGMAMYLQSNPLAFSKKASVNLNTYLYAARTLPPASPAESPAFVSSDREAAQVVELPAVIVTRAESSAPGAVERARPPASLIVPTERADSAPVPGLRELRPCSKFRELGPVHVDEGVPSGVRGVRDLCECPREEALPATGPGTT
jgi:hypothetical protein